MALRFNPFDKDQPVATPSVVTRKYAKLNVFDDPPPPVGPVMAARPALELKPATPETTRRQLGDDSETKPVELGDDSETARRQRASNSETSRRQLGDDSMTMSRFTSIRTFYLA